jgi:outer membrane protein assembly factor BamB
VADGTVYIGNVNHTVYALDAATGHLRWTYTTKGEIVADPVVAGSTVYIGSNDHNVYALKAAGP